MTPSITPNQTSSNGLLKWALILATAGFSFICVVELINILFYDPYEEERFLFSFAESLMETEIETLTLLMFGTLALLLMAGLPMAFVVGGLGVVFIYLVGGQTMVNIIPTRIYPLMSNADLAAIPLFIFMASMLEKAGLIEEMFDVVYKWMGGLNGGLAAATILASTILAAMVGVIGAAVVTMGIIALPAMLKRNYDHKIALGSIMAGGTLGILIPPSILAILYAVIAQQSVVHDELDGQYKASRICPSIEAKLRGFTEKAQNGLVTKAQFDDTFGKEAFSLLADKRVAPKALALADASVRQSITARRSSGEKPTSEVFGMSSEEASKHAKELSEKKENETSEDYAKWVAAKAEERKKSLKARKEKAKALKQGLDSTRSDVEAKLNAWRKAQAKASRALKKRANYTGDDAETITKLEDAVDAANKLRAETGVAATAATKRWKALKSARKVARGK